MVDKIQEQIFDDLKRKIAGDVGDAIMLSIQLIEPRLMLSLVNAAVESTISIAAMALDANNGVPMEKSPTREAMALVTLFHWYTILRSESPWNDAVSALKKHFPDAKVCEVEVVDRRKKEAA